LDSFLRFNEKEILDNPGKVGAEIARSFAEAEFKKYSVIQDMLYESDFDRSSIDHALLLKDYFRGREDVYVKLWINNRTGKRGYSPVRKN